MGPLYPGHVPTTWLQKGFIGVFSAFKALNNPHRADAVAALGEVTGRTALERLRESLRAVPAGRMLLNERPLLDSAVLVKHNLHALPAGTFGHAYAQYLARHGFDPDGRDAVRFVDDAELAWVMARYRQTHDFGHVLCGLPPTVLGEVALKWFEAVQTRLPMCGLSALAGPLALPRADRDRLRTVLVPWALRAGRVANPLLAVRFEDEFATPLQELRERLSLEPAPGDTRGLMRPHTQGAPPVL
jgi:ubiquinone biosynthesis protein COQ4